MKIILFGLRRSGTTLAFQIFRTCKTLRCFYEPLHPGLVFPEKSSCLNNDKKNVYSEYRLLGKELFSRHEGLGAPLHDVVDELAPNALTKRHLDYLDFLFESAPDVLIQPVRLTYQLQQLRTRYPDARFVWVVRQPEGFIRSVLTYRPDWLTYRDAGLASNRSIKAQKKNILLRALKGWNAFDNPWSQIAAANAIVQREPVFKDLTNAPSWIKLMALWYDHYRVVTEFAKDNASNFHMLNYEKACRSDAYVKELFASLQLDCSMVNLAGLIDAKVVGRQQVVTLDVSDGEEMIQRKYEMMGAPLDLSYRRLMG